MNEWSEVGTIQNKGTMNEWSEFGMIQNNGTTNLIEIS